MNDEHVTETIADLRDQIAAIYPRLSVCVNCESWHYSHDADHTTDYRVALLPGLDGEKCQQWQLDTIGDLREWIENHKRNSVTV